VTTERLEQFTWTAPTAKWVCVAGDFNDWRLGQFQLVRQADGTWLAWLPLRRPYAYKFIIDGLWKIDTDRRAEKVPNGFGELNSYRPAAKVTLPSQDTVTSEAAAGDARALDIVTSYAKSADYSRAVAMARKIAQVNAAALGSTSPLVLRALDQEAAIHRRWNRLEEAVLCWGQLAESNVNCPEAYRAINELAAYYLYVKPENGFGRQLNDMAWRGAPNNVELIRAVVHSLNLKLREARVQEALDVADQVLARLPEPTQETKGYGDELAELWSVKGAAHYRMKQMDKAKAAFEKAIQVSSSPDTHIAQRARFWLEKNAALKAVKP
jgi:tetratricopeptide (TPR) repeat protein